MVVDVEGEDDLFDLADADGEADAEVDDESGPSRLTVVVGAWFVVVVVDDIQ